MGLREDARRPTPEELAAEIPPPGTPLPPVLERRGTIERMWGLFAAAQCPPGTPKLIRDRLRHSFYAGCAYMLEEVAAISDEVPDTAAGHDAGSGQLQKLKDELDRFAAEMAARAGRR